MADIEVGKDLIGLMTLIAPPSVHAGAAVRLTSSNPALALLAPDTRSPGQAQINTTIPSSQSLTFYVYGLAAAGQVKVTADVAGAGSVTATVQLDPSGFGWSMDHYSATLYSQAPTSAAIVSFALDPATGIPVREQALRPGVSAAVSILNANPDIVSASPNPLTLMNFTVS